VVQAQLASALPGDEEQNDYDQRHEKAHNPSVGKG